MEEEISNRALGKVRFFRKNRKNNWRVLGCGESDSRGVRNVHTCSTSINWV